MADAGPSAPQPGDPADASDAVEERFGPLAVRRLVKGDGRTLILYRWADEPDDDKGEEP